MKKNNLLLAVSLIAVVGCQKKTPQSLMDRWVKKNPAIETTFLQRKLANTDQNLCMKDVFSVETLKEEVAELEKKFPGEKISGEWKHLDLSRLPVPQATFLKKFGDKIGDLKNPDSIDYSRCRDVPCIINKVYGKDNGINGYVHYIWYLKTGFMLSVDNEAPRSQLVFVGGARDIEGSASPGEYNGKQLPLSDFLFTDQELYGFWRLSHMLKAPYTTLEKLREIQRIPKGESFIAPVPAGSLKPCGLAYSTGWILLTDKCLEFSSSSNDKGYFYHAVTHELAHEIDFEQARGSAKSHRSQRDDYLNLTGFTLNEFVNPEGVFTSQWKLNDDSKLISKYARNSPAESFAEDLALFRVEGDSTRSTLRDEHYNFISQDYYNGENFENDQIIKRWMKLNTSETERAVLKVVMDCNANPHSRKSTYFKASDFNNPVLPGMINCYATGAEEISQLIKTKVLIEDPDGCNIIKNTTSKPKWDQNVKNLLISSFDKFLAELKKDKEYLARIESFYAELEDQTIARNSYLSCYGQENEESCYDVQVKKDAQLKASTLNLNPEVTNEMSEMYVSHHPFSDTQNSILKFYKALIQSQSVSISESAESLWERCLSGPQNDNLSPRGKHFVLNGGYMVSSLYNCINENFPDTLKSLVRSSGFDDFKIEHPNEEILITNLIAPELSQVLNKKYASARDQEKKESVEFIFNDEGNVRSKLLSDLSWVKKGAGPDNVYEACKSVAMKAISFDPLFHLKKNLFADFVGSEVCSGLEATKEFKLLRENETITSKILDTAQYSLAKEAGLKAKACLEKYPMGNILNKVRFRIAREDCLTIDWNLLETKVLTEVKKDPGFKKVKMKDEDVKERFDISRRQIQQDTISEYFGIF